jgi:hypothetical protein
MTWLLSLKLIRLFDFYLILAFLLSTALRIKQYHTVLSVVLNSQKRWPRLLDLVKQHRNIFLTWGTILPLLFTLGLWLVHTIIRRTALSGGEDLTVERLWEMWPAVPFVAAAAIAMLSFDLYGAYDVVEINQPELEKYFDQAEYWLRSWTAPVVSFFTLGRINPRQMVAVEVRNALTSASETINSSLWWMTMQAILRILFGLTLWLTFLFSR